MPMDQSNPLRCAEGCHLGATGWRSPPDPTDKQTDGKDQVVALAQALELMSGLGEHTGRRKDEVMACS